MHSGAESMAGDGAVVSSRAHPCQPPATGAAIAASPVQASAQFSDPPCSSDRVGPRDVQPLQLPLAIDDGPQRFAPARSPGICTQCLRSFECFCHQRSLSAVRRVVGPAVACGRVKSCCAGQHRRKDPEQGRQKPIAWRLINSTEESLPECASTWHSTVRRWPRTSMPNAP